MNKQTLLSQKGSEQHVTETQSSFSDAQQQRNTLLWDKALL